MWLEDLGCSEWVEVLVSEIEEVLVLIGKCLVRLGLEIHASGFPNLGLVGI